MYLGTKPSKQYSIDSSDALRVVYHLKAKLYKLSIKRNENNGKRASTLPQMKSLICLVF